MPTARRRLADVAWLDQKMQLGFLRRKVASGDRTDVYRATTQVRPRGVLSHQCSKRVQTGEPRKIGKTQLRRWRPYPTRDREYGHEVFGICFAENWECVRLRLGEGQRNRYVVIRVERDRQPTAG